MAFITPIGSNPAQVEYRLGEGHGCGSDRQFSYHADGSERPLVWTGNGLPEVGIIPGSILSHDQFDDARALMAGLDPRTGEVLVEAKRAIYDDAKVPVTPLVAAVQACAAAAGVDPVDLFAGNRKVREFYERAERMVKSKGERALLRADDAGVIADAAGVAIADVWGEPTYAEAVANLTEIRTVTNPDGTVTEVGAPRRRLVGNAGYDATFTLPKSMSLLLAFCDEDTAAELERAYQSRVGDTFDWLEAETAYGMRGHHGGGKTAETVETSGFLGWSMVHRSARPVGDAQVGDPHWHVHVTLANMAKGEDGNWSTVAAGGRDLMRHAPAADHVLKALIRRDLTTKYGVRFERSERTGAWEVAAIPDEVLRAFSKRGVSIEAMLVDLGFDPATADKRAKAIAKRDTTNAKTEITAAPDETLRSLWHREAEAYGYDPGGLAGAALTGEPESLQLPSTADIAAHIMDQIVDPETGVTGHMRRFTRVEALAAVADALPSGAADLAEIAAVTDAVLARHGIVSLAGPDPDAIGRGDGKRHQIGASHMRNAARYTTTDVLEAERVILDYAGLTRPGQGAVFVPIKTAAMAKSVTEAGQGFELSDEQARVYQAVVTSDQRLEAVIGAPGTGKTTLMRAVRIAYEAAGHTVAGAATAAVAAQNLAGESGIESKTVAQWVYSIEQAADAREWIAGNYQVPPKRLGTGQQPAALNPSQRAKIDRDAGEGGFATIDVLVIDEANLTDDRDRAVLYTEAARTGTKLIEVGDPQQLRGVGCGSLFGRIHDVLEGYELTDNRRQRDEDERAAIASWRGGRYAEALSSWAGRGRLVATDTAEEATTAMVAEWMRQRIGAPDAHTQMRGVVMLAASNEAVDRLNEAAQAVRAAAGELGAEASYRVASGRDVHLAEGDHVMIRLNDRFERMHEGPDVLNGYRGVVEQIHEDRSVSVAWLRDTSDGPELQHATLTPAFIAKGGLSLGYAMTGHKAEGLTVSGRWDRPDGTTQHGSVLVQAAGMDEPGLHVATSRHKDQVVLFAGRQQVEDITTASSLGEPGTDEERQQRVIDALTSHARRTHDSPNDEPVHDDLGQDPAADAKALNAADWKKRMEQLRKAQQSAKPRKRASSKPSQTQQPGRGGVDRGESPRHHQPHHRAGF